MNQNTYSNTYKKNSILRIFYKAMYILHSYEINNKTRDKYKSRYMLVYSLPVLPILYKIASYTFCLTFLVSSKKLIYKNLTYIYILNNIIDIANTYN